ncbi:sialate O-acetylesterase [Marinoscillum sp.]|uniref:sialate O-acetylesterase n=1 Tax=Marinoscillum sp. TaxID=2024838 RepID=UPI003BAC66E5
MKAFFSTIFILLSTLVFSQLKLPRLFADHMVIQRNQPTKVWGWTEPGEKVSVTLDAEKQQVKADKTGYWETYLKARKAGGPYTLMVVSGDSTITYEDVLVGDVWIAGGQSNMEWQLQWNVNNWEEEVKDSDYPNIRFFKVPNTFASSPQQDVSGGEWLLANPDNSPQFSAVAWFFAKHNHLEKNVPVGVVESHWGGTPAEAWTSLETLTNTPGYEDIADTIMNPSMPWDQLEAINQKKDARKWELMRDQEGAVATGAQNVDFDDSNWERLDLPCNCRMTDLAWLRREVNLSPDTIKDIKLYISNVVQEAFVFYNGELLWTKKWSDDIQPLEIPKELVRAGKNVITYRVANSWDNNVYFGRPGEMWLEINGTKHSLEHDWKYSSDIEPDIPMAVKMFQMPSFLYNAKIAPIGGYTARGVIWYQGESNADKPQYYRQLFTNMIGDWRKLWGDIPFLYVQLANFMQRQDQPVASDWAELREAQTQTLALPKTAMAVTIDIGNPDDIHPRNKQDVGARLWLAAKKVSYGDEVVYSGPSIKEATTDREGVILSFDHVGSGLKSTGPLNGFAVADDANNWYWAQARIVGDQVIVTSENVKTPKAVSYAWGDNPEAPLYNQEGLPAVPFQIKLK